METEHCTEAECLLYLTWCALHESTPSGDRLRDIDLKLLYCLCERNDMTALLYRPVEEYAAANAPGDEILKVWKDKKDRTIRRNILLDSERTALYRWMDSEKIWHMSLKGIRLKALYPGELRSMADNDILFDVACAGKVFDWFIARGYQAKSVGTGNHDVYMKPPVWNFEMHTSLYGPWHKEEWQEYYRDIKDRLIRLEGCEYSFTETDEYVYLISHMAKHYQGGGTGLRSLTDIALYIKAHPDLDWDAVKRECQILKLEDFEADIRSLAKRVLLTEESPRFSELAEKEQEMLLYMLGAGTYGNLQLRVQNRLRTLEESGLSKQKARRKYLRDRFFPPYTKLCEGYPIVIRYKILVPGVYLFRILRGIFKKKVWRERKYLKKEKEAEKRS